MITREKLFLVGSCCHVSGAGAPHNVEDELFEVLFASPGVDDARSQPESAVYYRAGEEGLTAKLDFLQNGFVQIIEHLNVLSEFRWRVAEAHDT